MNDDAILVLADRMNDVIDQVYGPGAEGEIALDIAYGVPLEELEAHGLEVLWDVAANLHLTPSSARLLKEEMQYLLLDEIVQDRCRGGKRDYV